MIHIWHLSNFRDSIGLQPMQAAEIFLGNDGESGYSHVATVNTDDLEVAFEKTNHIDQDWRDNAAILSCDRAKGTRSTSVGDIAIKGDGTRWLCMGCGWEQMP